MPSPSPEHPGLFIRDPYRYSESMLVIPPLLVQVLDLLDGEHTDLDLREALVRLTNSLEVGPIEKNLVETLSAAGFLRDETFAAMKREREAGFAAAPIREPAHAGAAYPAHAGELGDAMAGFLADGQPPPVDSSLFAIAAPHVSLQGGWRCYRDAYRLLGPEHKDRTFVILATSHYGEPEKFGLTRKPFRTPMGDALTDARLVDWLEERGGPSVKVEDYCHSFEHTVEFQVLFLQHALGPGVRILPILCGSYAHSLLNGGKPESDDGVRRFLDVLAELRDREGDRLFWILGVDMAHMGARYGDNFAASAGRGAMTDVESRDRERIARINACDAEAFWELVRENRDDLKWCGSSPFYTFLKAAPDSRGELLRYEQWNIDEHSVVTFAGMAFRK